MKSLLKKGKIFFKLMCNSIKLERSNKRHMYKENKYFYIFNDEKSANTLKGITGENYMKFDRKDGTKVYSFPRTKEVLKVWKIMKICQANN